VVIVSSIGRKEWLERDDFGANDFDFVNSALAVEGNAPAFVAADVPGCDLEFRFGQGGFDGGDVVFADLHRPGGEAEHVGPASDFHNERAIVNSKFGKLLQHLGNGRVGKLARGDWAAAAGWEHNVSEQGLPRARVMDSDADAGAQDGRQRVRRGSMDD
jgi:hypothetical protein